MPDLTPNAQSGLIDGTIDFVLSHPLATLARATVAALRQAVTATRSQDGSTAHLDTGLVLPQFIVPLEIYTRENV
ncbi:hypothetical protein DC439_24325 (plasmid) [Agrobacterium tumefaciens]|nr:hypothetical protein DC439_24325 [Agrobacterium tumefaciens]